MTEIKLYDPDGILVPEFDEDPVEIEPLASRTFVIPGYYPPWENEEGRPSFIVRWRAERAVHPAIIASAIAIINLTRIYFPEPPESPIISFEGLFLYPSTVLSEDKRHKK